MLYLMPFISILRDYLCPRFIFSSKPESTKGRSRNESRISGSGSPRSCSRLLAELMSPDFQPCAVPADVRHQRL